jgi:large subunit ribosomal protein L10e
MGIRPARTIRNLKKAYTRISRSKPRKSYVVGVPYPKIHIFEVGNRLGNFDTTLYLSATRALNIRDNALEAARIVATKHLFKKIGDENYFFKILVYPHQVLREHAVAMGAGADRYSQGMAHSFGKPIGIAVRTYADQRMIMLKVRRQNIETAKEALKRASSKLSFVTKIEIK